LHFIIFGYITRLNLMYIVNYFLEDISRMLSKLAHVLKHIFTHWNSLIKIFSSRHDISPIILKF
jgi:hypothetical protein